MDERNKLGLVGRVVLAGGALVGGLNSGGCLAVAGGVAGYYAGKNTGSREVGNFMNLPEPKISIKKWKDYNNSGSLDDRNEILEDIGGSIKLSDYGMIVSLDYYSTLPYLNITYTFLDADDNIVDTVTVKNSAIAISNGNDFSQGEYTVFARYKYYEKDFAIFRKFAIIE